MSGFPRGSTPHNTFRTSIDCRGATIFVTYSQNGRVIVEKTGADVTATEKTVVSALSQQDTLKFRDGEVEMQIVAAFPDGTVAKCDIMKTTAKRVLKEGVIEYDDSV